MEENINQQKQTIAEPPAPEITIRTMESDIKAVEQGGGEIVAPQPFTPPQFKPEEPKIEVEFNIPGYTGPEKAIFTPVSESESVKIETEPSQSRSSWWKTIAIIIGILIIIAGLGLLGYLVIFPWIFPKQMPAVQ
jgi:hypothetical protein